jgi:ADP-ribose pyrophosphatase YjhB (NUDIX family)
MSNISVAAPSPRHTITATAVDTISIALALVLVTLFRPAKLSRRSFRPRDDENRFSDSYVGQLRQVVGTRLLLVPGARIVIENDAGQVLLQKRSDFDAWAPPGGNAEEGESLDATITREVAEEPGLELLDFKPFGFGCDPLIETFTFPNGDRCQYFVLNYFSRSFRGVPRVGDNESTAIEWFGLDTLPSMLLNMLRSIEAYVKFSRPCDFQMI